MKILSHTPIVALVAGTKDQTLTYNEMFHAKLLELKIEHDYVLLENIRHNTKEYYAKAGLEGFIFQAKHLRKAR